MALPRLLTGSIGLPGPRLVSLLVGGAAAVLVLYPIVFLLQASLSVGDPQARPPEAYGLDNFTGLGRYAHIFGNTLLVAAIATVFAVLFGFTMGWILSRTNVPGRAAFEQLMAMPYYVTPLMGALAWALIASPNSGFVNEVWRSCCPACSAPPCSSSPRCSARSPPRWCSGSPTASTS